MPAVYHTQCGKTNTASRTLYNAYLPDLAGSSGVGKSAVMQHTLQQQGQGGVLLPSALTFSAQTTSIATQTMIEAKLERRHRNRQP